MRRPAVAKTASQPLQGTEQGAVMGGVMVGCTSDNSTFKGVLSRPQDYAKEKLPAVTPAALSFTTPLPFLLRPCLIDDEGSALEVGAIQCIDGPFGLL